MRSELFGIDSGNLIVGAFYLLALLFGAVVGIWWARKRGGWER